MEGGPWETLVTEAAELGSGNFLSFAEFEFGYRDNAGGERSKFSNPNLLSLPEVLSTFWLDAFFFFLLFIILIFYK